jgi:hypothetical protein
LLVVSKSKCNGKSEKQVLRCAQDDNFISVMV